VPLLRTLVSVFHKFRRAIGSMPVVGSSRNTIGGSPISAIAVLNLRLFPPLPPNNTANNTSSKAIELSQLKPVGLAYQDNAANWRLPLQAHHQLYYSKT